MQFFLLEILPRAQHFLSVCHRVVGAGKLAPKFLDCAEMGQNLCAIDPLPHERVIRQPVVLAPADLDRHEIFQARLLDQLRQRPGISKYVR